MKKIILLTVFVMGLLQLSTAQTRTEERSFEVGAQDQVHLKLQFGETISVKAWDKNEVAFKAVIEINGGRLDDALEVEYAQRDGRVTIASDFNKGMLKSGRAQGCPDHNYSQYGWTRDGSPSMVCSKISYEIRVPRNIELDVETISGDIELAGLNGAIRAKSISGFVDLSWPKDGAVIIDIKTVSGEAYTDLDNLEFDNKKPHMPMVGYKLKGKIGRNGPRVSLESVSGNIYLRESS